MVNVRLGQHGVVCISDQLYDQVNSRKRDLHSSSLFLKGGVLPAMMTSLALPDRRDFKVDLYPRVTVSADNQPLSYRTTDNMTVSCQIVPFPDFITSARRELIESADFLAFLVGAIFAPQVVDT